jgi:hypothetical protein
LGYSSCFFGVGVFDSLSGDAWLLLLLALLGRLARLCWGLGVCGCLCLGRDLCCLSICLLLSGMVYSSWRRWWRDG